MKAIVMMTGGLLLLLSAIPHGVMGWPSIRASLAEINAPRDLVQGLGAGWIFGSVTMVALGLIAIHAGRRLRRGDRSGLPAARIAGAALVLFGLGATLATGPSAPFAIFVACGLLIGAPALAGGARPESMSR